jgi:hypothetical protein
MNRLLIALLSGMLATACSSSGSGDDDDDATDGNDGNEDDGEDGSSNDRNPPTVLINTPERGTVSGEATVTVSGQATDFESNIAEVTVNGTVAQVASDGTFEATVSLVEGVTLIETVATDSSGNQATDARGVLAGNLVPQSTPVADGVVANLSGQAMVGLGTMISDLANATDFTALATSLNPVVNTGDGCPSAKVFILSVQHQGVDVGVGPVGGGIDADVTIRELVAQGRVDYRAGLGPACINASASFTLSADGFDVNGVIAPTLAGGDINVGLNGVTGAFRGFALDVDGIPGIIEDLFRTPVRNFIQGLLTDTIANMVPSLANAFLGDFLADSFNIDLLGQTISLSITPSVMNWTEQGGTIVLDTSSTVEGLDDAVYLTSPRPRPSDADLASTGIRIGVADDVLNQLLGTIWSSGALDGTLLPVPGDALSAAFGGDVSGAALTLVRPPVANFDTTTGLARLTLADLQIEAFSPGGEILAAFVISAEIELAAETSSEGRVRIITRAPRIIAQVLSQSDNLLTELTAEKVEAIAELGISQLSVFADDLLSNLPVPGLAGATIESPTFQPVGGYLLMGGNLAFE